MMDEDIDILIAKAVDNTLTPDEETQLNRAIAGSDAVAQDYLDAMQIHADLRLTLRTQQTTLRLLGDIKAGKTRRSPWPLLAAAAALVLAGLLIHQLRSPQTETVSPGPPVGVIDELVQARFIHGLSGPLAESDSISAESYELDSGIVQMTMPGDTTVLLQGPAAFRVIDEHRLQLSSGSVVVRMGPEAQSFFVEAPGVEVQDLGTVFGVEVTSAEYTDIHVYEGAVLARTEPSGDPRHLTRIDAGSALRVFPGTGLNSGIDLSSDRFITRLNSAQDSVSSKILDLKPVVYFPAEVPLDGRAVLYDASERRLDAEIVGLGTGASSWAPGIDGNALHLPGPTERMAYDVVPEYPKSKNNTLSGMAWVYAESRPLWASILKNWGASSGQFHFGLHEQDGDLEMHVMAADQTEIFVRENTPLPLSEWHHVAFVADGNSLVLYRNGEAVDSTPYQELTNLADIRVLTIGAKLTDSGVQPDLEAPSNWHGRLDEIALFNHALSAADVRAVYEATKGQ